MKLPRELLAGQDQCQECGEAMYEWKRPLWVEIVGCGDRFCDRQMRRMVISGGSFCNDWAINLLVTGSDLCVPMTCEVP
jgi:hypothetical protein